MTWIQGIQERDTTLTIELSLKFADENIFKCLQWLTAQKYSF